MLQTNRKENESREEAEWEAERERLAAERKDRRSAVLTEWERTCSPPQSEQVCLLTVQV